MNVPTVGVCRRDRVGLFQTEEQKDGKRATWNSETESIWRRVRDDESRWTEIRRGGLMDALVAEGVCFILNPL